MRARLLAELSLGRVAQAAELADTAPANAWLDAFELVRVTSYATEVAELIAARVAPRFTPADRRRFEAIRRSYEESDAPRPDPNPSPTDAPLPQPTQP